MYLVDTCTYIVQTHLINYTLDPVSRWNILNASLWRKWCLNEKENGFINKSLIDELEADLQLRGISALKINGRSFRWGWIWSDSSLVIDGSGNWVEYKWVDE